MTLIAPAPIRPWIRHAQPNLVVVGGVPGAGKSTALKALAPDLVGARILDPDTLRHALARRFPSGTPYRCYRPLVHLVHHAELILLVLIGPRLLARSGTSRLFVHAPATRVARLRWLGRVAVARGWTPALVYLEATRQEALAGQRTRGRVVAPMSFERHWDRWTSRRDELTRQILGDGWAWVQVVARHDGLAALRRL